MAVPTKVLEEIQAMYAKPNATFEGKPPSIAQLQSMKMIRAMAAVVDLQRNTGKGYNLLFNGPAGCGKTTAGITTAEALGLGHPIIPCANIDQENLGLPGFDDSDGTEKIVMRLIRKWVEAGAKVILLDEPGQADPGFLSAIMEILSEGSIGGIKVKDLVSVWMFDNPARAGYGDLSEFDIAQGDRGFTLFVDGADTPAEYGLALKYEKYNLRKLFDEYYRLPLDHNGREILSWRVVDHIIQALTLGFNGTLGRPIMDDRYAPITNQSGDDIGDEVVERFAKALGVANAPLRSDDFERALRMIPTHGIDIIGYGTQGTGKTSLVKATLADLGVNVAYKSAPVISKEDINLSVVSKDGQFVDIVTHAEFMTGEPTVGVFDEITRGQPRTINALMEIIQEHTSGGQPLPNYHGSVLLTNLAKSGGEMMDVEAVSLPFATRPDLNFILDPDSTGALTWLVNTYGEEIVPFTEWWRLDLDAHPEHRELVSPRCLERLYFAWKMGMELEWALPVVHGTRVPVPLITLTQRLGGHDVVSFLDIVENVDDYEARLIAIGEDDESGDGKSLRLDVYDALLNAELPTLQAHEDVCIRMLVVIGTQWRYALLRTKEKKWDFWRNCLGKAFPTP